MSLNFAEFAGATKNQITAKSLQTTNTSASSLHFSDISDALLTQVCFSEFLLNFALLPRYLPVVGTNSEAIHLGGNSRKIIPDDPEIPIRDDST